MRDPRWLRLESALLDHGIVGDGEELTNAGIAALLGVTPARASDYIQAYLGAQRSPRSRTLFVLRREGRTRAAVWSIGNAATDGGAIRQTFARDVRVKFEDAVRLDLHRLGTLNPAQAAAIGATIGAIGDGILAMLDALVGVEPE